MGPFEPKASCRGRHKRRGYLMKQVEHEGFLGLLVDCLERGNVAEQRLDVCDASICAELSLLLQVSIIRVVADVVACILTDATGMAFGL